MGLFGFQKKKQELTQEPVKIKKQDKLSYADKELIMVQRVKLKDMQQFQSFRFQWNREIQKSIQPHGHPFAYMDLNSSNIEIAKSELRSMNSIISNTHDLAPAIPKNICIPVDEIVFKPSNLHGYTRLICNPFTSSGEISQYPVVLSFMTDLDSGIDTTHGELFYGKCGNVEKATIYFWRRRKGYFFYFDTVNNALVLSKVELSDAAGVYAPPSVIYKGKHILEMEAKRKEEEKDYAWIKKNIPEKCPKSASGYRRMKAQNTKNYQILKQLAAELGREI